jgi:PEGA domain
VYGEEDRQKWRVVTSILSYMNPNRWHSAGIILGIAAATLPGCATSDAQPEKGPSGTIAHMIEIESSDPGARVEVNRDFVGRTPITIKVFADEDGTFHNFGSPQFVIQVFPVRTNQFVQTKIFRTGRWFASEDRVPKRLYFDLNQGSGGFTVDLPGK